MFQITHACAAVVFLDGNAEYAEIAKLAPQVHREGIVAIDRRRTWCDFNGGKVLHRAAQHVGRLPEVEVQSGKPVG